MQIDYEGQTYDLDLEDMDTDEARIMERFGVGNLKALEDGVAEGGIDALTVVFWLMKRQSGENVRLERVKFKPVKFLRKLGEAQEAENKKDKAKGKAEEGDPKEG